MKSYSNFKHIDHIQFLLLTNVADLHIFISLFIPFSHFSMQKVMLHNKAEYTGSFVDNKWSKGYPYFKRDWPYIGVLINGKDQRQKWEYMIHWSSSTKYRVICFQVCFCLIFWTIWIFVLQQFYINGPGVTHYTIFFLIYPMYVSNHFKAVFRS